MSNPQCAMCQGTGFEKWIDLQNPGHPFPSRKCKCARSTAEHPAQESAPASGMSEAQATFNGNALSWAVDRWIAEVKNRPLVNVHRSALDGCWRQVMRHFGGDPDQLVGASHDELLAARVTGPVEFHVGGRYNWRNQPERLIYLGRNGVWHQFAKVDAPSVVWCEVLAADLVRFEETR